MKYINEPHTSFCYCLLPSKWNKGVQKVIRKNPWERNLLGGKVRARGNLGRGIHPPVPPCKHASGKRPSILQKVFLCADVFLCNLISNLDQISNLEQLKNISDGCFWLSRLTVVCINVIIQVKTKSKQVFISYIYIHKNMYSFYFFTSAYWVILNLT